MNEPEARKQYQNEIAKKLEALENVNDDEDMKRAWENIKEHIKASAKESLSLHELKQHKPWFDEECLGFLDQGNRLKCSGYRIQAKECR
jgi:plasmid maintenance system killer protein